MNESIKPAVVFVMGPTCAGKTTLIDAHAQKAFYTIAVGRMMRAKFSPSHFKGSMAPKETEALAQQFFADEMLKATALHDGSNVPVERRVVLVDGVPRSVDAIHAVIDNTRRWDRYFLFLTADRDVRRARMAARLSDRFASGKTVAEVGEEIEFAMSRLDNDLSHLWPLVAELICLNQKVFVMDTGKHQGSHNASLMIDSLMMGVRFANYSEFYATLMTTT